MIRRTPLMLLAICLILVYQNCGKEDTLGKAMLDFHSASLASAYCQVGYDFSSKAAPRIDGGVQLDKEWLTQNASASGVLTAQGLQGKVGAGNGENFVLPSGTEILISVRHDCLNLKGHSSSSLLDRISRETPFAKSGWTEAVTVVLEKEMDLTGLKNEIQAEECIQMISHNSEMSLVAVPNDTDVSQQKFHDALKTFTAWDNFYAPNKGIVTDVVVAVIDNGVDINHPDLAGKIWVNPKETKNGKDDDDDNAFVDDVNGYNFRDNRGDPSPIHGDLSLDNEKSSNHGTHVAGIIAAASNNNLAVSGIIGARGKIMALNVTGDQMSEPVAGKRKAYVSDILNAIEYASQMGAQVINLSMGELSAPVPALKVKIQEAVSRGVLVVMAAGNASSSAGGTDFAEVMQYPAGYAIDVPGAIAVGSTDQVTKDKSSFSHYGNQFVEIAAPGSAQTGGILSLFINQPSRGVSTGTLNGTSMASPMVAAAGALTYGYLRALRGFYPTAVEVKDLILRSAEKRASLAPYFKEGNFLDLVSLSKLTLASRARCLP